MASRKRGKSRERGHRSAAQWLARLKGGEGKSALHLPPDFVLWVLAGLLAHLDRQGDAYVADLAEGALVHGGGLSVHDGTRWQSAGPAHDAALRAIAQAFADLDLTRGRRQDHGAWEMLDRVEAAYTGFCVGLRPDGTESDRDYLDEEIRRLGQGSLNDSSVRRKFRANLRRRLLRAALDDVARRHLSARATKRQIRTRGDEIQRHLQRAGLLKLVGGSVPFLGA
ncbi:MAG: hypothetical protein DMD87_13520 [Candidatus Rokuibacteriota bacterium]|nr:MAG: hypothetical protein DMD87_13520 [Candidatus Rokubacteria bacterium]